MLQIVQNISVPMQSVSSLCDSLKHLILTKLICFFLRILLLSATLPCIKSKHFWYAYTSMKLIPAPSHTQLMPVGDRFFFFFFFLGRSKRWFYFMVTCTTYTPRDQVYIKRTKESNLDYNGEWDKEPKKCGLDVDETCPWSARLCVGACVRIIRN